MPSVRLKFNGHWAFDFSRDLENLSPNLSPARREALNSPPTLVGKGVGGLGFALVFPHSVKSQMPNTQCPMSKQTILGYIKLCILN
jgi:hypothetical protein